MSEYNNSESYSQVSWKVRQNLLFFEGKRDAIQFALSCSGDIKRIEDELHEKEEQLKDPFLLQGPLNINASPRLYHNGYLDGLKEVLISIKR